MNGPEKLPVVEEKHIAIDNAVDYLEQLVGRISKLRDRISGDASPDGVSADKTTPSLHNVLAGTALSIREKCDSAHNVIDEIEGLLY